MNPKQRYLLIGFLILVASGGLWVAVTGWPPIIMRDRLYRELISDFQRAQRRDKTPRGDENDGWEFHVQVPERQTTVWVQVPSSVGVVTIRYDDERNSRALYRSAEYTQPVEIRTEKNVLYIHWVEPLFAPNHWLLAYDLVGQRVIAKRRLDPKDLP